MNETTNPSTTSHPKQTTAELAAGWAGVLAGPVVTTLSILLIAGLALSGIGIMGISAVTWLFSGADWFCGIGLLTGAMFLACATVFCLNQLNLMKAAISKKMTMVEKPQTT